MPSMLNARSGHGLAFMRNCLIVVGGYLLDDDFSDECEAFSFDRNTWRRIAPLNIKANNPSICTFNDKYLFKFGGKKEERKMNEVIEKYDFDLNEWTIVNPKLQDF